MKNKTKEIDLGDGLFTHKLDEDKDLIDRPPHYTNQIECLDIIEQQVNDFQSYLEGNIIKYCYRYKDKESNLQDIEKLELYVKRLKDHLKGL